MPDDALRPGDPIEPPRRTRDDDVWDTLVRWRARRRAFVLATVVETRGFTPRKSGARMLVAADGETCGTIGGGAIEQLVLDEARRLLLDDGSSPLAAGGSTLLRRHLTQELGMCCGGEMTVHLERIEGSPRLVVFGAGYIAKPLAAMAAGCGFDTEVVDARPEWANGERFPTSTVTLRDPETFAREWTPAGDEYVVVTTHDHAVDHRVVQHLITKPLRFLGMIGSIPKQRKFALRLKARGVPDDAIARLRTPLGLPIGAATPEEIGVSVVAELIAVRRGSAVERGWTPRAAGPPGEGGANPNPAAEVAAEEKPR